MYLFALTTHTFINKREREKSEGRKNLNINLAFNMINCRHFVFCNAPNTVHFHSFFCSSFGTQTHTHRFFIIIIDSVLFTYHFQTNSLFVCVIVCFFVWDIVNATWECYQFAYLLFYERLKINSQSQSQSFFLVAAKHFVLEIANSRARATTLGSMKHLLQSF